MSYGIDNIAVPVVSTSYLHGFFALVCIYIAANIGYCLYQSDEGDDLVPSL